MVQSHPNSRPNGPSLDFLLDGGLIPSLPDIGGRVMHHELMGTGAGMGMGRPPPGTYGSNQVNRTGPPQEPVYGLPYIQQNTQQVELPPKRSSSNSNSTKNEWQTGQITRSSSDEAYHNNNNNTQTQGNARYPPSGNGNHQVDRSLGHGKNHSITNIQQFHSDHPTNITQQNQPSHQYFQGIDDRPKLLRRTSSFTHITHNANNDSIPPSLIPGSQNNNETKLHHSISDSAVHARSTANSLDPSNSGTQNDTQSYSSSGIKLGTNDDTEMISNLLDILDSLIPKERSLVPEEGGRVDTRTLNPFNLLIPLSIILEALVNERTILKLDDEGGTEPGEMFKGNLPLLNNGISLVLENGEIDWKILNWYIESYNQILINLLPFFQDLQQAYRQNQEQGEGEEEEVGLLHDLLKSIKVYINKLKKVFGEIAGLYVDRYSFIRGFWDESCMKDSAGQVGKWSDLFDL